MNGILPSGGWVAILNDEIVWYDLIVENNNIPMKEYTSEKCFIFDKNTGTISKYLCDDKEVIIPPLIDGVEVESVGSAFFKTRVKKIILPENIDNIKSSAFQQSQLEEIVMPYSITSIGAYAFTSAKLKKIILPYNKTTIGLLAFNNNLLPDEQAFIYKRNEDGSINYELLVSYGGFNKNVKIPSGVKEIGAYAFSGSQLESVIIPSTVERIEQYAFFKNNYETLEIPTSINYIHSTAFQQNNNLKSIYYKGNVTGFPWGASNATLISDY